MCSGHDDPAWLQAGEVGWAGHMLLMQCCDSAFLASGHASIELYIVNTMALSLHHCWGGPRLCDHRVTIIKHQLV